MKVDEGSAPAGGSADSARLRAAALRVGGLLLVLLCVVSLGSSSAWSGSDAGGKAATARVAAARGTCDPDVGYWAEDLDPTGAHHQLLKTAPVGDRWVQATSLPFTCAEAVLWRLGGPALALALPIAGVLLAAVSAASMAEHLGGRGGAAFWLVGLGPIGFYGADLWEHAPAAGIGLAALALTIRSPRRWTALGIGLLFGLAGVLRAELVLVAVACGVGVLVTPSVRQRWLRDLLLPVLAVVGAAAVVAANLLIERSYLPGGGGAGAGRAGRATSLASGAAQTPSQRWQDVLATGTGLLPSYSAEALMTGGLFFVLLVLVAAQATGRVRLSRLLQNVLLAALAALAVLRLLTEPAFVPGMFAAAPLGVLGLLWRPTGAGRLLKVTALCSLPAIWLLSWRGDLVAQWGGRYLLVSGALLVVLGVVAAERIGWRTPGVSVLVGLTMVASLGGLAFHAYRTSEVAAGIAAIERAAAPDAVVLSTVTHLGREAGATYGRRRWLTYSEADLPTGARLARRGGAEQVVVVWFAADAEDITDRLAGSLPLIDAVERPLLGDTLYIRTYSLRG